MIPLVNSPLPVVVTACDVGEKKIYLEFTSCEHHFPYVTISKLSSVNHGEHDTRGAQTTPIRTYIAQIHHSSFKSNNNNGKHRKWFYTYTRYVLLNSISFTNVISYTKCKQIHVSLSNLVIQNNEVRLKYVYQTIVAVYSVSSTHSCK